MFYKNKIEKIVFNDRKDLEMNIVQFPDQFKKINENLKEKKNQKMQKNINDSVKKIDEIYYNFNTTYTKEKSKEDDFFFDSNFTTSPRKENLNNKTKKKLMIKEIENSNINTPLRIRHSDRNYSKTIKTIKPLIMYFQREMSFYSKKCNNNKDKKFFLTSSTDRNVSRISTFETANTLVQTTSSPYLKLHTPIDTSLNKVKSITQTNSAKFLKTIIKKPSFIKKLNENFNEISNENLSLVSTIKKTKSIQNQTRDKRNSNKELKELTKINIQQGVFVTGRKGDQVYVGEKKNLFNKLNLVKYMTEDSAYKSRYHLMREFKFRLREDDILFDDSPKPILKKENVSNIQKEREQKLNCLFTANKALVNVLKDKFKNNS